MQCLLLVSVLEHALVLMMGILLMVFNVCVVHIIDVGNRCVIVVVVEFMEFHVSKWHLKTNMTTRNLEHCWFNSAF